MAEQTKSPGTVANDNSIGTLAWSDTGNVVANDGAEASVEFDPSDTISNYLKATNFGFDLPEGATINGILVEIEKNPDIGGGDDFIRDYRVRIVKGGSIGSSDRKKGLWDSPLVYTPHGAYNDLWGETWTAEDVNASDFGVAIAVEGVEVVSTLDAIANIDHIKITVYFNNPQVRVSKIGVNALSSNNPNDYIFHSAYNTFKILAEGVLLAQTIDSDPKTITVAHGQSVTPTAFAFARYPDGYVAKPREVPHSGELERYFELDMDDTNLYFEFYKGVTANYDVDIKYFIFEAPV